MTRIALPIACRADGSDFIDRRSLLADLQPVISAGGFGPEMVLNGDFATDTIWTKGVGFVIAGGRASRIPDASSSGLSQPLSFIAGRSYRVTFTVLNFVSGQFLPRFTGGTMRSGTLRTANGTFTETLVANTGNTTLQFFASGVTQADIDDVSVCEVL